MRSTCCHERGWSHRIQIATCGFGRFRTLPVYRLPTFGYKRTLHSWRPRPGDQHGAQYESERKRAGDSNDRDLQHSAPPVESGPGSIHDELALHAAIAMGAASRLDVAREVERAFLRWCEFDLGSLPRLKLHVLHPVWRIHFH